MSATLPNGYKTCVEAPSLESRFQTVREFSRLVCEPLVPEDCVIQSMPDVSPTRWHLAHTTWFFETFLLSAFEPNYKAFHPSFEMLFNSYYNSIGQQFPRFRRGHLSRPTVDEVWQYRDHVDQHVIQFMKDHPSSEEWQQIMEIGLQHEQQHQELMLTDIKHVFSCNPLYPCYREDLLDSKSTNSPLNLHWIGFGEGVFEFGHQGNSFAFDNEFPRHRQFVPPFNLADRLVTNREYIEFIQDGGYQRPEFWLSMGWNQASSEEWGAPLYWVPTEDKAKWCEFTLGGLRELDPYQPVCHVSYFEADAYARWAGKRLPTEFEWELAIEQSTTNAASDCSDANFAETSRFHPRAAGDNGDNAVSHPKLRQMFGDVWEWTSSPYSAYPGYKPVPGALGEYNGKFMCNQYVLRGGSCVTSSSHIRPTYRNFFPPDARWQFSGIRLAQTV